jgi:hypothetical protein
MVMNKIRDVLNRAGFLERMEFLRWDRDVKNSIFSAVEDLVKKESGCHVCWYWYEKGKKGEKVLVLEEDVGSEEHDYQEYTCQSPLDWDCAIIPIVLCSRTLNSDWL